VTGAETWLNYFSWATVCNPFDRVVSLYNYIVNHAETEGEALDFPVDGDEAARAAWGRSVILPDTAPWNYPAMRAYVGSLPETAPFSGFPRHPALLDDPAHVPRWLGLCDESREALLVNEIVHLEQIDSYWPRFCERFGLRAAALPHDNVSTPRRRLTTRELFTSAEDRDMIRQRFRDDFRYFVYDPAL
jgi:hypothetical protein